MIRASRPGRCGAAVLGILFGLIGSAPAEPLDLSSVVKSAAVWHPVVLQAEAKIAASEAKRYGADGNFDTKLAASTKVSPHGKDIYTLGEVGIEQPTRFWGLAARGGWRVGRGQVPSYLGAQDTAEFGEIFLGLALPLLQGGPTDRARTDIAQADAIVGASQADAAGIRLALQFDAAVAYWDWVASGLVLTIEEKLLSIAVERGKQLDVRIYRGAAKAIDGVDNQRAILKRQGRVVKAKQTLDKTAITLSLFWRGDSGKPIVPGPVRLPGGIPKPVDPNSVYIKDDVAYALAQRPELRGLEAAAMVAQSEIDWARNQRWVQLDLFVDLFQGLDRPDDWKRELTEVEAGIKLTMPLQRRKATGSRDAAMAELRGIEAKADFAKDKIRAEVEKAHVALVAAFQAVELKRQELDVTRQLEEAERRRFDLGASTLFVVNLREISTADAAIALVESLADYQRAWAGYAAITTRGITLLDRALQNAPLSPAP